MSFGSLVFTPLVKKLQAELDEALPNAEVPSYDQVKDLVYLDHVIQETLRLTSGISYRITRSAPNETLQLGDWTIPPNVGTHSNIFSSIF